MPAPKPNFIQGHEYDLGNGTTAVWGGKRGWMSAADYVAMKGQSQNDFDNQRAMMDRLSEADKMTAPWDATGMAARVESGEGAPQWFPFKGIGGTAGYNLNKKLVPVRANAFIQNLQSMRNNSPTGGAVGNVTEGEGEKLASTDAILDVGQSREQLRQEIATMQQAMGRHTPGLTVRNPADLTEDNRNVLPQGAYFRTPDGRVFQNRKGAGFPGAAPAAPNIFSGVGQQTSSRPVQVRSVDEAMRLPKGTVFITPDGRQKVR